MSKGPDLFSYFGGVDLFSSSNSSNDSKPQPTEPPKSNTPAAVTAEGSTNSESLPSEGAGAATGGINVVNLAARRLEERRRNKPEDDCDDACSAEEETESEDKEDEGATDENASESFDGDDEPDERAADRAELGGRSANTEVKGDQKAAGANPGGKKEEAKPKFDLGTFIAYAGHTLSIGKYFGAEQLESLDLEAVRKRLEKDFPELSKQRTKMEWDEKKNLVIPMVTGGKKGAFFSQGLKGFFFRSQDLAKHKEPINILAGQDGYYEVRENPIGVFVSKVPVVEELEPCREGFKMNLPKIPADLFTQLVTFFYDYACFEVEVMGVFYWDTENDRYVLDVPFQSVSKTRINVSYSDFPPQFIKVAEIHSHNTMPAWFSDIDDEDEKGTMLYGIVGRIQKGINQVKFDLVVRAGVAGRFIHLEPETIIEGEYPKGACVDPIRYPMSWQDRVRIDYSK
ncbi:hypothetical protein [Cohnella soli]|uniref:JAB domain-containing protein n=1 Tax=Cohnella soli TaxID=425005 RepID=A0ABW0HPQ3_9BACL